MPVKKYENAKRGNVYAIPTDIGYGFFQCVGKYEQGIDTVRVLRSIWGPAYLRERLEEGWSLQDWK